MDRLKLVFSHNHHPGEILIRVGTWSEWGHCGILFEHEGEVRVIDTRPFHGVKERTLAEYLHNTTKYQFKEVEVPDAAKGIAWARAQVGKSYDWGGVISFAVHRDWSEDDRWFCSELAEGAIQAAGRDRFIENSVRRISPQMAWIVV